MNDDGTAETATAYILNSYEISQGRGGWTNSNVLTVTTQLKKDRYFLIYENILDSRAKIYNFKSPKIV